TRRRRRSSARSKIACMFSQWANAIDKSRESVKRNCSLRVFLVGPLPVLPFAICNSIRLQLDFPGGRTIAADEIHADEDDGDAREDPGADGFAGAPADEDSNHGVDVSVGAHLGDADVAKQPIEGNEA